MLPVSLVYRVALESLGQPPHALSHTDTIAWLCTRATVTPATLHYIRMLRSRNSGELPHARTYLYQEFASAWITATTGIR